MTGEIDTLEARFFEVMDCIPCFEKRPELVVAVSGGSDSLALCLLAGKWAERGGGRVVGLTVDHGLRKEAAAEAEQVQKWLKAAGMEHHILRWREDKPQTGIQAAARQARYDLMEKWCARRHYLHLLTAHHLDDQAETVLMRLERGSGAFGLAGMAEISAFGGVRLIRPLLSFGKDELRHYLLAAGQEWLEDPSNQSLYYRRNRIRGLLGLEDDLLTRRLAATAVHLGRARISLERLTAAVLAECATVHAAGYALLDRDLFCGAGQEEALRALSALLCMVGGHRYAPRFDALHTLYRAIRNALPRQTLWGCQLLPHQGKLLICRQAALVDGPLAVREGEWQCWDNRFRWRVTGIETALTAGRLSDEEWRQWRKEHGKMAPHSLPRQVFITLPVFKTLDSIVAIPHIGYYREGVEPSCFTCRFQPTSALTSAPFGRAG